MKLPPDQIVNRFFEEQEKHADTWNIYSVTTSSFDVNGVTVASYMDYDYFFKELLLWMRENKIKIKAKKLDVPPRVLTLTFIRQYFSAWYKDKHDGIVQALGTHFDDYAYMLERIAPRTYTIEILHYIKENRIKVWFEE